LGASDITAAQGTARRPHITATDPSGRDGGGAGLLAMSPAQNLGVESTESLPTADLTVEGD
jgi:hypothetical protein